MGAMSSFFNSLKLAGREDYENDYLDDVEEVDEEVPQRAVEKKPAKVASINRRKSSSSGDMELVGVEPSCYEDATQVMDLLLQGKTVILKLNKINQNEGRRLLDTVSGCSYAVRGNLKEFAENIFIVAPDAVSVEGAFIEQA